MGLAVVMMTVVLPSKELARMMGWGSGFEVGVTVIHDLFDGDVMMCTILLLFARA